MLQSFKPVVDKNCRILILGSMPGVKSLEKQQYYAHKQNHFWPIISALFGQKIPEAYAHKQQFLLQQHIALWDVVHNCRREGSSDSAIKDPVANDFGAFYRQYSQIKTIFFNGGKAEELYLRLIYKTVDHKDKSICLLPSTSPANTLPYAEKLARWQIIRQVINNS